MLHWRTYQLHVVIIRLLRGVLTAWEVWAKERMIEAQPKKENQNVDASS